MAKSREINMNLPSADDLFTTQEERDHKNQEYVKNISLFEITDFPNHPFKVRMDAKMVETIESVREHGVLVPALVREKPTGGYEMISGHRRKMASELAGLENIPCIVRNLSDDEAVIVMVDSNLQREEILPSEKAFAYKMKLEAMSRQGQRSDLTSGQVDQKLKNRDVKTYGIEIEKKDNEELVFRNSEKTTNSYSSRKELAMQIGESERQIQRYIRLTNLIPQILEMVDAERIAFTVAVELSYLKETEQYELYAVMDLEQCTPSLTQAHRMKMSSQSGNLDMDNIYCILEEEKPNQKEKIKIPADLLEEFFPENFTEKQKIGLIKKLVEEWYIEQNEIDIKLSKR